MHLRRSNQTPPIIPILMIVGVVIGAGFFFRQNLLGLLSQITLSNKPQTQSAGGPAQTGAEGLQPAVFGSEVEIAADGFPVEARKHVIKYTVRAGDTVFGIADRFGISPDTIFWANTDTLKDNINLLFVDVQLYILPVDGVYHASDGEQPIAEIAAQYSVAPGDILYSEYNQLSEHDSTYIPPKGLHIVVPGGKRGYISWQSPIQTGTESGSANPEGTIHPGSCRAHYTGLGGEGSYINPLGDVTYRVTNGFAAWHPGVDLAADYGTPIYAAETGVVVFAGWHRQGYGELIILDHGDGWTTYYGHLSKRFVGCGDQITEGQIIGEMGSSGNATGVHLHFEIRNADSPQNPYDLIPIHDERSGS
jgi:murein DD-endopeptidase MepM/ murein hydrolase activator NlpD